MNVSLTPELETLVNQKVKTGRYTSASEVVREALRLLEERDRLKELRRDDLRAEIMKGVSDIKAGRSVRLETPEEFDRLAARVKRDGRKQAAQRKSRT